MTDTRFNRILTAGLVVFLTLGVLELAFRAWIFPQYADMLPNMYERHPVLGHYNRANLEVRRYNPHNYDVVNHTNAFGMRGREESRERELAGVWVLGSSNTFGGYVADDAVFSARLRAYGRWAANLASEGHTLVSQVRMMRMLAAKGYRPKAVLMSMDMGHIDRDYSDGKAALTNPLSPTGADTEVLPSRPRDHLVAAAEKWWATVPENLRSVRARLLKSSALYGAMKVGVMEIPAFRQWTLDMGLRADIDLSLKPSLDYWRPLGPENPVRDKIRAVADFASDVREYVQREYGVPFGIVLLASNHDLSDAAFEHYIDHFGLRGEDLAPGRAIDALKVALDERGVPAFEARLVLRAEAAGRRLTFPDDGHLTAIAHDIIARHLATWLDHGLAPVSKGSMP